MKCGILYYDGFSEFEVVIALQNLAPKAEILGVGLEKRPYVSEEKQMFLPAVALSEARADDFDIFLIPGGDASPLLTSVDLKAFLNALKDKGKIVAAICGGVLLLGAFGMLQGKRFTGEAREFEYSAEDLVRYFQGATYTGEDVVVDGNIVTGMGQAFVEFGIEVADLAGVFPDHRAKQRELGWYKNI